MKKSRDPSFVKTERNYGLTYIALEKNAERNYGINFTRKKNGNAYSEYGEVVVNNGVVEINSLKSFARKVSKETGEEFSDVFRKFIERPKLLSNLEKTLNVSMIVISLALIVLTFVRAGIFTGNAISDLGDATIDLGVIIGLVVLAGLFFWKQRLK